MRKDKQKRLDAFAGLIDDIIIAGQPQTMKVYEGFAWAALSQAEWCQKLKLSDRTLRDLAKCCPPIVSTKTINEDGKPIVLYRIGSHPHQSQRHLANIMAKMFRDEYGVKRVPAHDWGCLVGLAGVWPDGVQVDIFKTLLADFKAFIVAVKACDPECPHSERYYEWLPIGLVRKYHAIALELYIAAVQASGKMPHPSIVALYPELWPNLGIVGPGMAEPENFPKLPTPVNQYG